MNETVVDVRRSKLAELVKREGSQTALAIKVGRSPQHIGDMIRGQKSFGEKVARDIEDRLGLERGYLDGKSLEVHGVADEETTIPFVRLPALNIKKDYGIQTAPKQIEFVKQLDVEQSWFYSQKLSTTNPKQLRIISASSDNMDPTIHKGDVIIVDVNQTSFNAQGVYAIQYSDTVFINRVQMLPGGGVDLLSDNPRYHPVHLESTSSIVIIGRCINVLNAKDL